MHVFNHVFPPCKVGPDTTLPFFNADTQPMLIDHSENIRHAGSTIEAYAHSIEKHGNVPGVRGLSLAQLSEGDQPPYNMLTYRQLSKAVYVAHKRLPCNQLVQASVTSGLPNSKVFTSRMPKIRDQLARYYFNAFRTGSS